MSHTRQGFPAGPETSRRGPERVGHRLVRIYIYLPTLGTTSAGVPAVPPLEASLSVWALLGNRA